MIYHFNANASHPYTLSSRTSQPADQNLPKSMAVPTHGRQRKIKHGHTTKAIRNLGNVLILRFIVLNKISDKLKINRFIIPNYA